MILVLLFLRTQVGPSFPLRTIVPVPTFHGSLEEQWQHAGDTNFLEGNLKQPANIVSVPAAHSLHSLEGWWRNSCHHRCKRTYASAPQQISAGQSRSMETVGLKTRSTWVKKQLCQLQFPYFIFSLEKKTKKIFHSLIEYILAYKM